MNQSKFEALTKALVTEGPRRGFLGAIAGGALGLLVGFSPEEAEAGPRQRRQRQRRAKRRAKRRAAARRREQNRCRAVNRTCVPFEANKCCSNRCCPALGAQAQTVSVCAPERASQCCPASLGGGYCDLEGYKVCCPPTALSPEGTCCGALGSSCCAANTVHPDSDYCCPPGSHCCDEFGGCCANVEPTAQGFGAASAVAPQAARRRAG